MRAPLPRNESERLAALHAYGILDTPREEDFDEIVSLAAEICGVPIALVSFVDADRQWFKAEVGAGGIRETPVDASFCAHAILGSEVMEVADTHRDPRFQDNVLVTSEPHLRFYAGAPIASADGYKLGTLCVLDREPRQLTSLQRKSLEVLAKQVMTQLELRRQARNLVLQRETLQTTLTTAEVATWNWDVSNDRVFGNALLARFFGVEEQAVAGGPLTKLFEAIHPDDRKRVVEEVQAAIRTGETYDTEYRIGHDDQARWVLARGSVTQLVEGGTPWLGGVNIDITARKVAEAEQAHLHRQVHIEREKLRSMLAEAPAFSAVLMGRDLVFEFVNEAYYRIVGQRPIVGLPILKALPEIEGQGYVELLHRVMDTNTAHTAVEMPVTLLRTAGGPPEDRYVTFTYQPLREEDGTVVGVVAHGIDVTDHVLVRRELAAERQQFKTLLDEIPAHVVTLRGPELRYEFANREFMRFVGRDDFVGMRAQDAWPVPDEHIALLNHILTTGETFAGQEAPVQSPPVPDREPKVGLFDFVFQPLREGDGTVSGVFVHSLDVTEKVLARQELAARAEQLRTIFDRAEDDAMILTDADRIILAWNRGAERICGWTADEAVGISADVIFTAEDRAAGAPNAESQKAEREGKATDERWHVRKDGTRFWGSGTMTAIHNDDGEVRGFLKVFRDATAKRRETETLAFLRDLTDAVLNLRQPGQMIAVAQRMLGEHLRASGCTYYELEADQEHLTIVRDWAAGLPSIVGRYPVDRFGAIVASAIREGRLLSISDVASELPPEEGGDVILGLGIQALICAPLWKGASAVAGLAVNANSPRQWMDHEIELVRVVADRVWSEVERARAEEELRKLNEDLEMKVQVRTQDLAAAIREAEGFNYAIAHDLRAPLRAIVATSRILQEEVGTNLAKSHGEMLDRQVHNATRLGVLIDQLLALSRLARAEVQRSDFDMTELADEIVAELRRAGLVNSCRFEIQADMTANGDARLVRMALTNLLENACKFSPKGGRIEIRCDEENGERIFTVRDEGIGFDMQYAHKLFLPFERLVLETDFPGTGIGLANVERVVRRHGGRVWADGKLGEGATFSFTLGS